LRVIAGEWRGRKLIAPEGRSVRPTSDRLKGSLFSILGERVRGARFADLFAGSGSIGIEALSRGAAFCLFVESDAAALAALRRNLAACGLEDRSGRAAVRAASVSGTIRSGELAGCGLVFADPPYESDLAGSTLLAVEAFFQGQGAAGPSGEGETPVFVLEHRRSTKPPETAGFFAHRRSARQGEGVLSFYGPASRGGSGGHSGPD
jgi:16S rRNA (guanine(966)-N(2))-methyltransferase RsmD